MSSRSARLVLAMTVVAVILATLAVALGVRGDRTSECGGRLTGKTRLVIDTDGITDDIRAITLAVNHPNAEVVAITTVHGCTSAEQALINVKRTLKANNYTCPVYLGAKSTLLPQVDPQDSASYFGGDGAGEQPSVWPAVTEEMKEASEGFAPTKLIEMFKNDRSLTLVCLGPLTNIAIALKIDPMFATYPKKVVVMGGNMYARGNVHARSSAEWNWHVDPEAASIVMNEMKSPVTIVPYEAISFHEQEYTAAVDVSAHLHKNTNLSKYLNAVTGIVRKNVETAPNVKYVYIDEVAVSVAIDPQNVIVADGSEEQTVDVETCGRFTRGQLFVTPWPVPSREKRRLVKQVDIMRVDACMNYAVEKLRTDTGTQ